MVGGGLNWLMNKLTFVCCFAMELAKDPIFTKKNAHLRD